ncbi:MarR family transcriptional regulator [soil metagenome]
MAPMADEELRLAAWQALAATHASVAEQLSARLEREVDLPLTWFLTLRRLAAADGERLRMSALADRTPLTKSGLSRLADRMEAAGLIERTACPSDRRGSFAVLTAAGQAAVKRALPVYTDAVLSSFGRLLSPEEARTLQTVLDRIAGAAGGDSPPPCA